MLAPRPVTPDAPVPGWLGAALGLPAGAAAALVATVLPHGPAGIAVVVLVAVAVGTVGEPLPVLATAVQVWACWDGFVRHASGVLAFGPADLAVLVTAAAVALTTAWVAALGRLRSVTLRGYAAGHLPAPPAGPAVD